MSTGPSDTPSDVELLKCENQDIESWARNSRGEDPCRIASELVMNSACGGGDSNTSISALADIVTTSQDGAPSQQSQNWCLCSSTVYALTSVCRLCQIRNKQLSFDKWSQWTKNCDPKNTNDNSSLAGYPPGRLPTGSSVPAWAYQVFVETQDFNISTAQQIVQTNISDISGPTIATSVSAPQQTGTDVPSQEPPVTSSTSSSKRGAPVGAIVGGVVGGVCFILLVIGLLAWLYRRKQRNCVAPSTAYIRAHGGKEVLPAYINRDSLHGGATSPIPIGTAGEEKAALALRLEENSSVSSDSSQPIRQDSGASDYFSTPVTTPMPLSPNSAMNRSSVLYSPVRQHHPGSSF